MIRLIALLVFITLPFHTLAQNADQPSGTIAVADDARQDAAIAERIRGILSELEGYDDVTVDVASGIVTLRGDTIDGAAAERLSELVSRVEGVVAIENEVAETTDVVRRLNPAFDRFRDRAQQVVAFLPLAAVALVAFFAIAALGFVLARMKQPWDRLAPNAFIADIYRQVLRLLFILGALVVAMDLMGATALLSGILGAAGIVGLAIGFAVRDTVENFIASIMLSIRQPFRPNDTVEIEGDTGKVIRLTSRATILLSFDGNHIRIPNSTVFKSRIVNFSRNAERRFNFSLSVKPDTDLAHAQTLSLNTLNGLPFVLKTPAASVWIESVDDSYVTMSMAGWIDQNATSIVLARSEAIRLVQAAFDTQGIGADVPAYRVVHEGAPFVATREEETARAPEFEGPAKAPTPAQPVEATEDKELAQIVDMERAGERSDLLRENGEQE
ncbi:mechanosensitive ion channel family protein [Sulfitobacter sp. S190]|uniref:mechanosensitive ion channel family protein n=1 Tax=Sulfitobacter sp. S190 TaxID=2867022 RepID=UPI0021A634C9|nr:mechanosensitive ion channel family protein [Sulfitobacter sp. S190]UWR21799.1 mechanosensitive ion channel [Sulfitobacter sp. S190]